MSESIKKARRSFTIDDIVLKEFKKKTKEQGKPYTTTINEAIKLWLKQNNERNK